MNHSYVACWRDIQDGIGEEPQLVALIKVSLLLPAQSQWLVEHKLTIEDLLNGRYPVYLESVIHAFFYKAWNDMLEKAGLQRSFSEDPIGAAMIEHIEKTLGKPIKFA